MMNSFLSQVDPILKLKDDPGISIHPAALFVNPDETDYIPIHYVNNTLYLKDQFITSELSFDKKLPVVYSRLSNSSRLRGMRSQPISFSPQSGDLNVISKIGSYYVGSGLLMTESEIVFALCLPTTFVRNMFVECKSFMEESLSWNILKDHPEHLSQKLLSLLLSKEFFDKTYTEREILTEKSTLFINEELFNNFVTGHRTTIDSFSRSYKDVVVDTVNDYFLSSMFLTMSYPTFENIDDPEKLLYEVL